jgi:hypothetical protein
VSNRLCLHRAVLIHRNILAAVTQADCLRNVTAQLKLLRVVTEGETGQLSEIYKRFSSATFRVGEFPPTGPRTRGSHVCRDAEKRGRVYIYMKTLKIHVNTRVYKSRVNRGVRNRS